MESPSETDVHTSEIKRAVLHACKTRYQRQQSLRSFTATVYYLDDAAVSKNKWIPAAGGPSTVRVFPWNTGLRIISVDNDKPIMNSIVCPNTKMIQCSSKFLYWNDQTHGVTYGLGFEQPSGVLQFLNFQSFCAALLDRKNNNEDQSAAHQQKKCLLSLEEMTDKANHRRPGVRNAFFTPRR